MILVGFQLHYVVTHSLSSTHILGTQHRKKYMVHAWNEPGTAGAPKKCLISSWNHTLGVDDHVKLRWSLNASTGEGESITRTVKATLKVHVV